MNIVAACYPFSTLFLGQENYKENNRVNNIHNTKPPRYLFVKVFFFLVVNNIVAVVSINSKRD